MEQIIVLAALLGLCYILLRLDGLIPPGGGLIAMGLLLAGMAVRWWLWNQTPSGAEDAVRDAILWFRGAGAFWGLRTCAEPFSPPMQAVLAACALRARGGLDAYKYICLLGDILTAWFAQRCVARVRMDPRPRLSVFVWILILPSLLLQGSASMGESLRWVWVAAAAWSALGGRPGLAGMWLGLAGSFHPLTLCVIPLFWCFPAVRQNGWRTLGTILAAYVLSRTPSLLMGRALEDTLPFWQDAAVLTRRLLAGGAPGLYSLPWFELPAWAGCAAFGLVSALMIFRLGGRDAVHDRRRQLAALAAGCAALGALLPWMNVSVLYGAEVLLSALCALEGMLIPASLCVWTASAFALGKLLFPALLPWPLWWAAAALGLGLLWLFGHVMFKRD